MKTTKILLSISSVATLAFTISACSNAPGNNSTANNANKNTAVIVNSNQTAVKSPTPALTPKTDVKSDKNSNAADDSESETASGELMVGKTDSVILYVGEETGDYAAYCFTNDSDAGRAILAACKDKEKCEVKATLGEGKPCEVPGLEADLSAEFRIVKVGSAKSLGRRK